MDLDFLEEIKIQRSSSIRRPRRGSPGPGQLRQSRSSRITIDSVKNRRMLIEDLRRKDQVPESPGSLSAANIVMLKDRLEEERRRRSGKLVAISQPDGPLVPFDSDLSEIAPETQPELQAPQATPSEAQAQIQAVEPVVCHDVGSPELLPASHAAPLEPQTMPRGAQAVSQAPNRPLPQAVATAGSAKEATRKRKSVLGISFQKERQLGNRVMLFYLVKELFLYFAICFVFFFVVFFVNQILLLAETVLRQRVPVSKVVLLIVYSLPSIVAQSAPFATLVGFLMCIGRMATDNEILILRASGIRYSFIAVPVLIMGLLISLLGFAMNDYFLPLGLLKYNRLRKEIIQNDPAVEVEANSVKHMNGTTMVIGGVDDDGVITDLVIFDKDSSDRDRVIITGRSEVAKSDEPGILMQFGMSGATVLEVDRMNNKSFDVFESQKIQLNVFDSILIPSEGVQPREMTSYDLWKIIQIMKKDENVKYKMMNRYNLEFAKKFSLPFGSIFFALLAFPLALIFGKRDGQTLGMIFGIIISVVYWAASILGQMFGVRSGWNGFWMMWGPNFFIGIVGLLLYLALRKK